MRPRRSGLLRKNSGKTKSCHTFTRSICGNQAAGKAEEDEEAEEAEEVAVSNFVPISLSLSLFRFLSASPQLVEFLGNIFKL